VRRFGIAFATVILFLSAPAFAQDPADFAGTWVWSLEGKTLFAMKLEAAAEGLEGTLERPREIEMEALAGTFAVTRVEMPVTTYRLFYGGEQGRGHLLRAADPEGGPVREYVIERDGQGGLVFALSPSDDAPRLLLRRPASQDRVATDWQPGRTYMAERPLEPSNPEMIEIFAADQADRLTPSSIDWSVVAPRDRERRKRVRELLDQGLLRSGEDFAKAAFVFQHGEESDDYLLAHALAMAAQAKGRTDAAWIGAASLDRYLDSIGKQSVFGTQFDARDGKPRGNNDRLVTGAVRTAVGVPSAEEQAALMRRLETGR